METCDTFIKRKIIKYKEHTVVVFIKFHATENGPRFNYNSLSWVSGGNPLIPQLH